MAPETLPPADAPVAIVGGGLAGSLLALALAKRGHWVDVYERRADPRRGGGESGRSINLGLSKRGIQALDEVGLLGEVMQRSVAMEGRVIHSRDGRVRFQPYGKDRREVEQCRWHVFGSYCSNPRGAQRQRGLDDRCHCRSDLEQFHGHDRHHLNTQSRL